MATRSAIGMEKDGKILAIYCHWDGYLENNGEILYKHYQTTEKIFQLLSNGDLSSLGAEIGEKHEFNSRSNENWCKYYGRDRGEDGVEMRVFDTRDEFVNWYSDSEYFYLWTDKHWIYSQGRSWMDLGQAIESIEAERAE
jgi:hypothetical protein